MNNQNILTKEKTLENNIDFEFDFAMCHGSYCCC